MYTEVKLLILSGMAYLVYRMFRRIARDDHYANSPEAEGIITKITNNDSGNIRFYVSFLTADGRCAEGQSIYYSRTYGKYEEGDLARFKYNIKPQSTSARIKLIDEDIRPCQISQRSLNIILTVSLLFLFSAVVLTVMRFI